MQLENSLPDLKLNLLVSWTSKVKDDLQSRMEVLAREGITCLLGVKEQSVGGKGGNYHLE